MDRRFSRSASCRRCRMLLDLCLCDATPRLDLATRVVVFMHRKEFRLLTNTGVLAHRVLANSRIVYRGDRASGSVNRDDFLSNNDGPAYVLYPAEEAEEIDGRFAARHKGPLTLVCPDGHWAQARKILRREGALRGLPCVKLPGGQVTNYRLRRHPVPGRVCTFEAIAGALGVLEGPEVREAMHGIFEKMVTRLLWTRGKIPWERVVW